MLFAYQAAFGYGEFGYAAALGCAMVIAVIAVMRAYLVAQAGGTSDHAPPAAAGRAAQYVA